ncbi:MAG: glycerophosphodiester phosphodiesterase [Spirochaetales bacterium]|nr:glycerophosphodiester phosphodiesterase [Spirochaetales bacterium]
MTDSKKKQIFPGIKKPLLFGHRGYSHLAPENTLAAFSLLLDYKIPGVELDVYLCRSGELVVVHDDNLLRLGGYNGFTEQTDYTILKTLDVGSHIHSRFKGERIPLLSEVFDLLQDQVYYDIELKTRRLICGELEKKTVQMVNDYGLQDRVLISSFNPFSLKTLKAIGWSRNAIIYSEEIPFYLRHGEGRFLSGCSIIKPQWKMLQKQSIHRSKKKHSFPVITWTVDDPVLGLKLLESGVTGIISNNPGIFNNQGLLP